ncbi:MAG: ABC transporter substrate-binding protein, partial [Candidatus Limnocylindrales bacterium]
MTRLRSSLPVVAAIMLAACGTGTDRPASQTPASSGRGAPTAPPPNAAGSQDSGLVKLFDSSYKPESGTDGGQIIIGDWQEANQFNPFYAGQVTEANVASAVWATLVVFTHDYKYAPDLAAEVPTLDNGGVKVPGSGGDGMTVTWKLRAGLKWSDGEPLTCDDFKFAQEWVTDKDNTGIGTLTSYQAISAVDCTSDTEMVWHFPKVFEGYITLAVAPLPRHFLSKIAIKDQVAGAGFRSTEISKMPVSGAFKFDTVTPGAELRLVKNPNYTSFSTGKPAHLDALVWKWYGDADA